MDALPARKIALACLFAAIAVPTASAGYMQQYNLITTGNFATQHDVEGRAFVGGNLGGTNFATYAMKLAPASNLNVDTLTVVGNIGVATGNAPGINLQAGNLLIGGTNYGTVNYNGGGHSHTDSHLGALYTSIVAELNSNTSAFASMSTNSTVYQDTAHTPSGATFIAHAGSNGVAVFAIDASLLSSTSIQQFDLTANGATSIVINVTGAAKTGGAVVISNNFVNGWTAANIPSNVIWNFVDATSIDSRVQFFGAILATKASITNSTAINGSIFARSMTANGEIHLPNYTGVDPGIGVSTVPEPGTFALLGLGGIGLLVRSIRTRSRAR